MQALMLPEAVRMLHLLLSMGRNVYVHCTAGINRATLTVVGYLTFVKGWPLENAVGHVKHKRPQAHPYIDCWQVRRAAEAHAHARGLHVDAWQRQAASQSFWHTDHRVFDICCRGLLQGL